MILALLITREEVALDRTTLKVLHRISFALRESLQKVNIMNLIPSGSAKK
jgi:hypothetical protein